MRRTLPLAALALALAACAGPPKSPLPKTSPAFVIERDLLGAAAARGRFKAINGTDRAFTAYLEGVRSGATFTLKERFEYDDGEKDHKTWVLTLKGDGTYAGVREDVVGEARGWQDGNAFRLEYDVRLPNAKGEPGMQVRFRDVMVKSADGVVINHATVGKWGLQVASVKLEIKK